MLFNSWLYLFLFLPLVAIVYFRLNHLRLVKAGTTWLVLASLVFYSYWNPKYLFLILASIVINYSIGSRIATRRSEGRSSGHLLGLGVATNLGLLGYFKYTGFFIRNASLAFNLDLHAPDIVLPLAISFFTFQQIAFLVDINRGRTSRPAPSDYLLFVTFFPQLIAGPIVHHREMMPQFSTLRNKLFRPGNLALGIHMIAIGLFKKVVVADSLSGWVQTGFSSTGEIGTLAAWGVSLGYTLQLYFDFSGYMDMALGSARIFNIRLPINFDSPYKSMNIQDFWRRWHITLGNFLKDYLYIPLGGNRVSNLRNIGNILITFLLGGLWHGAGWTFVVWGGLHGLAVVIHGLWKRTGIRLPAILAWGTTFLFVNAAWVFFRAETLGGAMRILKSMVDPAKLRLPSALEPVLGSFVPGCVQFGNAFQGAEATPGTYALALAALATVLFARNSHYWSSTFKPTYWRAAATAVLLLTSLLSLHKPTEFLYFQF